MIVPCPICGTPFDPWMYPNGTRPANHHPRQYCSPKCRNEATHRKDKEARAQVAIARATTAATLKDPWVYGNLPLDVRLNQCFS